MNLSPSTTRFLDERKAMACIHCGLCLGSCPTYLETGNENASPRGRIYLMRALQEDQLPLEEQTVKHIDQCLGCRACEAACPSGVEYGALLESTRDYIERSYRRSPFQAFLRKVAIEKIFPFPERMELSLAPARFLKHWRLEKLLPGFAREILSLIPEKTSQARLPPVSRTEKASRKGRVGFISGCVMQVMFGGTNAASVRLLNEAGYDVLAPLEQGCCGALYAHGGNLEKARQCARHNLEIFEAHGLEELDAVIINAAGCGSTLKEYGHLLEHDPLWSQRAARFSAKTKDLTEFLIQTGWQPSDRAREPAFDRVTYHDACHLAHPQRITQPPRDLVRMVAGSKFVELPESDVCCGSAGSYNLTEPEMAERLQKRKIENILGTGADLVVTTNPGCLLQIKAGLKKAGAEHIQALHIAEFLQGGG